MSFAKGVPICTLIVILIQVTRVKPQNSTSPGTDDPHWIQYNNVLPTDAIVGGFENETLYIIRAPHEGSLTPGKFVPSSGEAIIPWGGRVYVKKTFEILCGKNYNWVATTTKNIPARSVIGGFVEITKEPLYVGRAKTKIGQDIPGKVAKSEGVCYYPYGDKEVYVPNFEILVTTDQTNSANRAVDRRSGFSDKSRSYSCVELTNCNKIAQWHRVLRTNIVREEFSEKIVDAYLYCNFVNHCGHGASTYYLFY